MQHINIWCIPKEKGWSEQEIEMTSTNTLTALCESLHMAATVSPFSEMHRYLRKYGFSVTMTIHRAAKWEKSR